MSAAAQAIGEKRIVRRRPPKAHPFLPKRAQSPKFLVWLRRTHGWLGIWGAVAGILFGLTTVLMVHSDIFPTEPETRSAVQLPVNGTVIGDVDRLGAYVKAELGLATGSRPPRSRGMSAGLDNGAALGADEGATEQPAAVAGMRAGGRAAMGSGGRRGGAAIQTTQPVRVTQFTSPLRTLDVRYIEGNEYIEITRTERGFFNTLNRLHRGNGAQLGWTLIGDAFSGALIVLAISGVLLWSRMDGSRVLAIGLGGAGLLGVLYFGMAGA